MLKSRKSIRLRGHDYARPGAYFVVIMPNHFHAVVWIRGRDGDVLPGEGHPPDVPTGVQIVKPVLPVSVKHGPDKRSVGSFLAGFKSITTRRVNEIRGTSTSILWQHNFYDRIVRDTDELNRIRQYIRNNPLRWEWDRQNPTRL